MSSITKKTYAEKSIKSKLIDNFCDQYKLGSALFQPSCPYELTVGTWLIY